MKKQVSISRIEREEGQDMECASKGCDNKAEYEHKGYYYCPCCWDIQGCSCGYANHNCQC